MKMSGKPVLIRWVIVGIIVLAAMVWGYKIISGSHIKESLLPVYGQRNNDSTDHVIADFAFMDQAGKMVTQDDFKNKIYVADFFFTNCEGICPVMSNQLVRVAEKYKNTSDVLILSHTVKPEEDSIPVLKQYAEEHKADPAKWYFVTGEKSKINLLARTSYLVAGNVGEGDEDFVHTQFFALIDPQKRIRGFYDGTDSVEVNKLINDIAILLREQ